MSTEKFTISGEQLLEKIKQLIREGNIRRVSEFYTKVGRYLRYL